MLFRFIHCIIISLRNSINLIILTNCWDKIVLSVFGKCSSRAITMQLAGIRKHKYYKTAIQCSNNNNNSKDIFLFYQHIEYNSYYRIVHFYTGMTQFMIDLLHSAPKQQPYCFDLIMITYRIMTHCISLTKQLQMMIAIENNRYLIYRSLGVFITQTNTFSENFTWPI